MKVLWIWGTNGDGQRRVYKVNLDTQTLLNNTEVDYPHYSGVVHVANDFVYLNNQGGIGEFSGIDGSYTDIYYNINPPQYIGLTRDGDSFWSVSPDGTALKFEIETGTVNQSEPINMTSYADLAFDSGNLWTADHSFPLMEKQVLDPGNGFYVEDSFVVDCDYIDTCAMDTDSGFIWVGYHPFRGGTNEMELGRFDKTASDYAPPVETIDLLQFEPTGFSSFSIWVEEEVEPGPPTKLIDVRKWTWNLKGMTLNYDGGLSSTVQISRGFPYMTQIEVPIIPYEIPDGWNYTAQWSNNSPAVPNNVESGDLLIMFLEEGYAAAWGHYDNKWPSVPEGWTEQFLEYSGVYLAQSVAMIGMWTKTVTDESPGDPTGFSWAGSGSGSSSNWACLRIPQGRLLNYNYQWEDRNGSPAITPYNISLDEYQQGNLLIGIAIATDVASGPSFPDAVETIFTYNGIGVCHYGTFPDNSEVTVEYSNPNEWSVQDIVQSIAVIEGGPR